MLSRSLSRLPALSLIALLFFLVPNARGQRGHAGRHGRGRGFLSPQERVDQLDGVLKLTADQKAKMLDVFKDEEKQLAAIDDSLPSAQQGDNYEQINQATWGKVRKLLTAEQNKTLDELIGPAKKPAAKPSQDSSAPPPPSK